MHTQVHESLELADASFLVRHLLADAVGQIGAHLFLEELLRLRDVLLPVRGRHAEQFVPVDRVREALHIDRSCSYKANTCIWHSGVPNMA